jgi:hypothetical protein
MKRPVAAMVGWRVGAADGEGLTGVRGGAGPVVRDQPREETHRAGRQCLSSRRSASTSERARANVALPGTRGCSIRESAAREAVSPRVARGAGRVGVSGPLFGGKARVTPASGRAGPAFGAVGEGTRRALLSSGRALAAGAGRGVGLPPSLLTTRSQAPTTEISPGNRLGGHTSDTPRPLSIIAADS